MNPVRFTDPTGRCVDADFGCGAQGRTIAANPDAFAGAAPYAAAAAGILAAGPLAGVVIEAAISNPATTATIINSVAEGAATNALGGGSVAGGVGILANRAAGKAAEALAGKELLAEGNKILGSQVGARTSAGLRFIDHLVQSPGGKMTAVEVKAGNGMRNAAQLAKDGKMATEGAILTGKNAPDALRGQKWIIETIERRYPNK